MLTAGARTPLGSIFPMTDSILWECLSLMTWGNTIIILLGTHDEVDDWVDGRVGHGQPEEDQEDVLGGGVGSKSLCGRK